VLTKVALYVVLGTATLCLQMGFDLPSAELLFGKGWSGAPIYIDCLLGIALGTVLVVISRIASQRYEWTRRLDTEFRTILGPLTTRDILMLALMSSITEELFFRGFLQPQIGLEASALVFGLAHFPYRRHLLPWTIAAICVGWVFGWIFEARHCLFGPIIAHFVVNYFNLHYILRPRVKSLPNQGRLTNTASLAPRYGQAWLAEEQKGTPRDDT
jgi:membrane protease YdiL (CAAX protease family)